MVDEELFQTVVAYVFAEVLVCRGLCDSVEVVDTGKFHVFSLALETLRGAFWSTWLTGVSATGGFLLAIDNQQ